MPAQPEHTALPLEQFIAQLQAAGFHIDTGRKLRLLRLLNQKSGEYIGRFSELKYVLAPFIASSPAEQQRFYEFFDAFIEDCNREMEQWADRLPHEQYLPLTTPRPDNKTHKLWRRLGWIGMVILLATAALFVVKKWLEPEPIPLRIETGPELTPTVNNPYPILREGRQHQFAAQPANADTARYIWELRDAMSDVIELRDTGRYFDYTANGYGRDIRVIARSHDLRADSLLLHIHCADPPPMPQWDIPKMPALEDKPYAFGIAPPGPDAGVQWIFNGKDTLRGAQVSYSFVETGEATVECKVFRDSTDCYSWEQRRFTIGADKPIMNLADLIYDDTPPTVVRQSPKTWVWLLCFLPLLPAVWFLRRWWRQRREKPVSKPVEILVGEHPIHDKAPYFIPYLPPDGKISTPPDFYRMAEVLRRREESEHRELDIPASVRATVDGGGFPTLLDKSNTTPPDYLFIIERASAQDQQGRLFERLSSFFLQQDAPLTAYFHEGGFRGFWNDAHPQGVSFEFLQKQHSDCRLVLIGTGHGLLDPRNTREPALLRAQLDPLLRWKKALFLSTLPVSGWFAPEVLLHRHFLLFPADAEGIRTGLEALDALEEYEPEPYEKWESALASRRSDRNPRFQAWESAEQHRDFLQPDADAFRWLCGLAVSVAPDFALTVAIGRKLGIEVSHDRLLRLTRIPWLSRNEPDTRLRLELLVLLTDEEERLAREAVAEELEAVRQSVEGSFAHIEWKTNLAIHRFALDPENPENRQTLRDLMQVGLFSGSQIQELDGFVRRRLAPSSLVDGTDYGIIEHLDQPDPKPFFTASLRRALAWVALALGLLFLMGQQQRVLPPTLIKTVTQSDSAVIWHNQAIDTALAIQHLSEYSQWEENYGSARLAAEALFEKALSARTPYPLAEINRRAFLYNMAAQGFNFAVQDSIRGVSSPVSFRFERQLPDSVLRSKRFQAIANAANLFQSAIARADTTNRLGWAARHGYGLCAYYFAKDYQAVSIDTARVSYEEIMRLSGGEYFESIKKGMPVNLHTLMERELKPSDIRKITLQTQVVDPVNNRTTPSDIGRLPTIVSTGINPSSPLNILIPKPTNELKEDEENLIFVRSGSNGDGSSWQNAFGDLQKALEAAESRPSARIWVAEGKYTPTSTNDRNASFVIPSGVTLLGGFAGFESSPEQRDWRKNPTILSGEIGSPNSLEDNSYTVVLTKNVSAATIIDGFVISSGTANGTVRQKGAPQRSGAGWYNDGSNGYSNPTVLNCLFINNYGRDGAAFYNYSANGVTRPRIENCQFVNNHADLDGGALYNNGSFGMCYPIIINCLFEENEASYGAAIFNIAESGESLPKVSISTFNRNLSYVRGSSIYNNREFSGVCDAELDNSCSFSGNIDKVGPTISSTINNTGASRRSAAEIVFNENPGKLGLDMVRISSGSFIMGCQDAKRDGDCDDDEKPPHTVRVQDFSIGRYEVTQAQWRAVMEGESAPSYNKGCDECPVEQVSWNDIQEFLKNLNALTGKRYRLPTEAEWEYAARGGSQSLGFSYSGSNNIDEVAWYGSNSGGKTRPIGGKKPNELGLYDMSGNVWEWVEDDWHDNYSGAPTDGRAWVDSPRASNRIYRGGGWYSGAKHCRAALRTGNTPPRDGYGVGFRLAL